MVVRDDRSGRLTSVATPLLRTLLAEGTVPVLSPPALAEDGLPVNVNADRVAATVAAALGAARLVLLTGAPGVLADSSDPASVRAEYQVHDGRDPAVGGGMTVKLTAAREALEAGVEDVRIADGRFAATVADALDGRGGTRIVGAGRQVPSGVPRLRPDARHALLAARRHRTGELRHTTRAAAHRGHAPTAAAPALRADDGNSDRTWRRNAGDPRPVPNSPPGQGEPPMTDPRDASDPVPSCSSS